MNPRRKARETALQVLYAMDMTDRWQAHPDDSLLPPDPRTSGQVFAKDIVQGVFRQKETIDQTIQSVARHWHLSRMSLIDRNLLRIAAYEILYCDDIPGKVSINEALELAKAYGNPETRRFLNGILDKIAREKMCGG
jgi:N utilization substance protein B